jgi:hypothetical protein
VPALESLKRFVGGEVCEMWRTMVEIFHALSAHHVTRTRLDLTAAKIRTVRGTSHVVSSRTKVTNTTTFFTLLEKWQNLFGAKEMRIALHLMTHMIDDIKKNGPMVMHSGFITEDKNREVAGKYSIQFKRVPSIQSTYILPASDSNINNRFFKVRSVGNVEICQSVFIISHEGESSATCFKRVLQIVSVASFIFLLPSSSSSFPGLLCLTYTNIPLSTTQRRIQQSDFDCRV